MCGRLAGRRDFILQIYKDNSFAYLLFFAELAKFSKENFTYKINILLGSL